jgi:hypothetical protein
MRWHEILQLNISTTLTLVLNIVSTKFHDFKIVPPASPSGGIIIYELARGNISKKRNVVDPKY